MRHCVRLHSILLHLLQDELLLLGNGFLVGVLCVGLFQQLVLEVELIVVVLDVLGRGVKLLKSLHDIGNAYACWAALLLAPFEEVVHLLRHDVAGILPDQVLGLHIKHVLIVFSRLERGLHLEDPISEFLTDLLIDKHLVFGSQVGFADAVLRIIKKRQSLLLRSQRLSSSCLDHLIRCFCLSEVLKFLILEFVGAQVSDFWDVQGACKLVHVKLSVLRGHSLQNQVFCEDHSCPY